MPAKRAVLRGIRWIRMVAVAKNEECRDAPPAAHSGTLPEVTAT
jgi:hypothetical protein